MSDNKAHIRDVMSTTKKDLDNATVTTKTLCGLEDESMTKLRYADPFQAHKVTNPCEKCLRIWKEEAGSDKDQKKAYHGFRKIMHDTLRGDRFRRR